MSSGSTVQGTSPYRAHVEAETALRAFIVGPYREKHEQEIQRLSAIDSNESYRREHELLAPLFRRVRETRPTIDLGEGEWATLRATVSGPIVDLEGDGERAVGACLTLGEVWRLTQWLDEVGATDPDAVVPEHLRDVAEYGLLAAMHGFDDDET